MKNVVPTELQRYRVREGAYGSDASYGMAGAFRVFSPKHNEPMLVMSSGVDKVNGWEHVSVSMQHRSPTWDEMTYVKNMFWREDETVVQFHPAQSEYVDFHPHCLHMWKPIGIQIPLPPVFLVGPSTR